MCAMTAFGESATVERWMTLSQNPERVRNLCVLAHVDHGKTTLSDSLIAHNGLMHPKMAGKLRYMDFRDDEQARVCVRSAGKRAGGQELIPLAPPSFPARACSCVAGPGHNYEERVHLAAVHTWARAAQRQRKYNRNKHS